MRYSEKEKAAVGGLSLVRKVDGAKSGQPDTPDLNYMFSPEELKEKSTRLPYAKEKFRQCSADHWSHDAWRDWFDWSRKLSNLRGGDFLGSERTIDSRYSVRWSDSKMLGETPGALHVDQARAILEEFGVDIADFDSFWEAVFACLMLPQLTPAALRKDAEVYGNGFRLADRLEECKTLLRERRLIR